MPRRNKGKKTLLDPFEKRRNKVSSLLERRDKMMSRTISVPPKPVSPSPSTKDSSCSVVENSDTEFDDSYRKSTQKYANKENENIVVRSSVSSYEEILNTSMVCLSRNHSFFTDSSSEATNIMPSRENTMIDANHIDTNISPTNIPKVIITSNILITDPKYKVMIPKKQKIDANLLPGIPETPPMKKVLLFGPGNKSENAVSPRDFSNNQCRMDTLHDFNFPRPETATNVLTKTTEERDLSIPNISVSPVSSDICNIQHAAEVIYSNDNLITLPISDTPILNLPCEYTEQNDAPTNSQNTSMMHPSYNQDNADMQAYDETNLLSITHNPPHVGMETPDKTFCEPSASLVVDSGVGNNNKAKKQSLLTGFDSVQPSGSNISESTCNNISTPSSSKNENPQNKNENHKRKRTRILNIYKDFISEEENEDFSAGSSDVWSQNESESSSNSEKKKSKNKKRRRVESNEHKKFIKKTKRLNKRKVAKVKKNKGESYETRSGKIIEEKIMKENPCRPNKCQRGCHAITEERRASLFNFYMGLDPKRQRDWILKCVQIMPINRKKTKLDVSRRQITYKYFINEGDDRKQVCQKFLINTLNITQKLLLYSISKATEGMVDTDKRKRHVPPTYTEESKAQAKKYIESLPAVPSHRCRARSERTYLPQEFQSLANLYRLYQEHCTINKIDKISESLFRSIFTEEYTISFHKPKKDKCTACIKFDNIGNETNEDGTPKEPTQAQLEAMEFHKEEKQATYDRFKAHQSLSTPFSDTLTSSFDLQKVLNTPYGKSMLLYYSRKYAVYNFTVYESGYQNVECFVWGEADGKRGSNEIATCLYKYLEEVDKRSIKNVLLYCDSCPGQNKNRTVLSVLNNFVQNSDSIQVIQINFLLPGHTYMPVDSVHAVIERQTKHNTVWAPSQWPTLMETARKNPTPYKVNVLEFSDFIDFDDLTNKTFTTKVLSQIQMRAVRVATFRKKHKNVMEIKYSMAVGAEVHPVILFDSGPVKVRSKGKGKGKKTVKTVSDVGVMRPKTLYTERLPISEAKYRDLKKLCDQATIPRRFHPEYATLPFQSKIKDKLPETDEEDEIESE